MVKTTILYADDLYKLAIDGEKEGRIPSNLHVQADNMYKYIKYYGIDSLRVKYKKGDAEYVEKGKEIPERVRALADFIERIMNRWDTQLERLDDHFGLTTSVENILYDTGLFTTTNVNSMPYITLEDVIEKGNWKR